jgi:(p)ppGpp synthase/HD superfamily hydrolase
MQTLTLEQAISFASLVHAGQYDLSGQHYILHPLTLMMQMDTDTERIIAILHDVVEDTHVTFEHLIALGLTEEMLHVLKLLTREKTQDYFEYVKKIKSNPMARKIKIADLEHNMNLKRTLGREDMTDKDKERIAKYYKAWTYLTGE